MRIRPVLDIPQHIFPKLMFAIRAQVLESQHLHVICLLRLRSSGNISRLHLNRFGEIAAEMGRVDHDPTDGSASAQTHQHPVVMPGLPAAFRFPAVAHVVAAARQEQVGAGAEMLVAARHGHAAHDGRAQFHLDVAAGGEHGKGLAVEAKPRDAAVREHEQTHMRHGPRGGRHGPPMPSGGSTVPLGQHFRPPIIPILDHLRIRALPARLEAAVHGDALGMIAIEIRRVDLHPAHEPGRHAQLDHDPVEQGGVVATCFPPVVPGPRGDVDARASDWRGRGEEVGGWGEPLVRGGEDTRAEWGGYEICNVGGVERRAKVGVWGGEWGRDLPIQVELKVLLMRSAGMESSPVS